MRTCDATSHAFLSPIQAICLALFLGGFLISIPAAEGHLVIIRHGPESAGALEAGDRSGTSIATGDFNGDGFEDLAIGAPGDDQGALSDAGVITIVFGSPNGLTHVGGRYRTAALAGGTTVAGAGFGFALATGDFNNDGLADLAVGAPFDEVQGHTSAGLIYVFEGVPNGISVAAEIILSETEGGGAIENDDEFGAALVSGDFNDDGYADLAAGAPGEDTDAGAIFYFPGSAGGLTTVGAGFYKQSQLGGTNVAGDRFGQALAVGNFYDSSHIDLAASAPYRTISLLDDSGIVYLIRGSATGLLSTSSHSYHGNSEAAGAQANAWFGLALAAGDFDIDGYTDLAIGEPGRTVDGQAGAGRVQMGKGTVSGLSFQGFSAMWLTQWEALLENPEPGDHFGAALAVGDWNGDGHPVLAIGSPDENRDGTDDGLIHLFFSSPQSPGLSQVNSCYLPGDMGDRAETGDHCGAALAFGLFDDSGRAGLAVGMPGENTSDDIVYDRNGNYVEEFSDAGCVAVLAPWRQPQEINGSERDLSCAHAVALNAAGEMIYSKRPFDRVRPASLAQVMTLLIACERTALPVGDPDRVPMGTSYTIPAWVADDSKVTGNRYGLRQGDQWTLIGLMDLCLAFSANDAAFAIADLLTGANNGWEGTGDTVSEFVAEMNARAAALGMTGTLFTNPAGRTWGDPYTTPIDMAVLGRVAMENTLFASIAGIPSWNLHYENAAGDPVEADVSNNFIQGLRDAESRGAGIKSGRNRPGQRCGLYSAVSPLDEETVIAAAFGWRTAVGSGTRVDDAASLLRLAFDRSTALALTFSDRVLLDSRDGAPVLAAANWIKAPSTIAVLPTIDVSAGARAGGGGEALYSQADSVQLDVFSSGTGATGVLKLQVAQRTEMDLGAGQAAAFGVAPFESHLGFVVVNEGAQTASLRLITSRPPGQMTVGLAPGGSTVIPGFTGGRVPRFTLTVENLSTSTSAELIVSELGYETQITVSGGMAAPTATGFTAFLLRRRDDSEGITLGSLGLSTAGSPSVDVAVHEPGTPVAGEIDKPPDAGAPVPALQLLGASPNPFQRTVRLQFDLAREARVGAAIVDVQGRLVDQVAERPFLAGNGAIEWNSRPSVGPGVYFFRLTLNGRTACRGKLIRLR